MPGVLLSKTKNKLPDVDPTLYGVIDCSKEPFDIERLGKGMIVEFELMSSDGGLKIFPIK